MKSQRCLKKTVKDLVFEIDVNVYLDFMANKLGISVIRKGSGNKIEEGYGTVKNRRLLYCRDS